MSKRARSLRIAALPNQEPIVKRGRVKEAGMRAYIPLVHLTLSTSSSPRALHTGNAYSRYDLSRP